MPMIGGEGMSPTMCITNTDSPSAVARSFGATAFTSAEFTGPVDMKIRISARMPAARYVGRLVLVIDSHANGAASSVAMPHTHKYACLVFDNRRSPIQTPTIVPTTPVKSAREPHVTVAWL